MKSELPPEFHESSHQPMARVLSMFMGKDAWRHPDAPPQLMADLSVMDTNEAEQLADSPWQAKVMVKHKLGTSGDDFVLEHHIAQRMRGREHSVKIEDDTVTVWLTVGANTEEQLSEVDEFALALADFLGVSWKDAYLSEIKHIDDVRAAELDLENIPSDPTQL